jgi:hypothetical protein
VQIKVFLDAGIFPKPMNTWLKTALIPSIGHCKLPSQHELVQRSFRQDLGFMGNPIIHGNNVIVPGSGCFILFDYRRTEADTPFHPLFTDLDGGVPTGHWLSAFC